MSEGACFTKLLPNDCYSLYTHDAKCDYVKEETDLGHVVKAIQRKYDLTLKN